MDKDDDAGIESRFVGYAGVGNVWLDREGLRFTTDRMIGTRFTTLRERLGDSFIAVELPGATPRDHSVLTEQRDDASVERVIGFLRERLVP